jgi:hypothetical protein
VTSPEKTTPQNKAKKQMVDLTLDDHEENQNSFTRKKQKINQKTPMEKPRSRNTRQKAVQWKDTEEVKTYHPNHPVSHSTIPQSINNPFAAHSYPTKPVFFQQAAPPPPPPHYFPQAQNMGSLYHTNHYGTAPYQLPQQYVNGVSTQNSHQSQVQGIPQNPFQPFGQNQSNLMYTNPFGTPHTLHPQNQNKN